jgi:glycine hydroxymethyltransferase
MQAVGSVLMNKYAEGQVGKRYYQGNRNIDEIEKTCKENALKAFNLDPEIWHVNVQAVTGGIANFALLSAILEPGDKIMAMDLTHGGHLSHGWKLPNGKRVSFSSKVYDSYFYKVSPKTYTFDYDQIEKQALEVKPKLIISGGTAYSRTIDFKRLSEIAHKVGAKYFADVAHEAGLVAGGVYPSPFEFADFVNVTTRKTLRGPIGALMFCRQEFAEAIDRAVFPGLQGGPMMNSIAGIAVALEEANTPEFKNYTKQIVKNASVLAEELIKLGFKVITGGTDTHLILIDIRSKQPDGLIAAELLEQADIILNKNTIPYDESTSPWRPSGIRLGTPAVTTRGMKEKEMKKIAELIDRTLGIRTFPAETKRKEIREYCMENKTIAEIQKEVHVLTAKFPIYVKINYELQNTN